MLNGPGIRNVLFVAGCNHGCKGCYNESTWNPNSGFKFTSEIEETILRDLKDERIVRDGITFSGGDPLHERNIGTLLSLARRIREDCPTKTIWCWTGYTLEELANDKTEVGLVRWELANTITHLVDGRFEIDKHDPSLHFRGSWNQKIYEMPSQKDVTPDDVPKRATFDKIELRIL